MIIIAKMLNIRRMGPLINALNEGGVCHEIDFKRSDYLEFNMWYYHHVHRTGLVLVEACFQSGLPVFEGAEHAMHK